MTPPPAPGMYGRLVKKHSVYIVLAVMISSMQEETSTPFVASPPPSFGPNVFYEYENGLSPSSSVPEDSINL